MSKSNPNKDSGLLGNLYDLNGDGRTDAAEAALMFMIYDEMTKDDKCEKSARQSKVFDLDEWDNNDNITDIDDLNIKGI